LSFAAARDGGAAALEAAAALPESQAARDFAADAEKGRRELGLAAHEVNNLVMKALAFAVAYCKRPGDEEELPRAEGTTTQIS